MIIIPDKNDTRPYRASKPALWQEAYLGEAWKLLTQGYQPSYSSLSKLLRTNRDFLDYIIERYIKPTPPTDAMQIGTAVDLEITRRWYQNHKLQIAMELIPASYLVWEEERRTNEQKAKYSQLCEEAKQLGIPVLTGNQKIKVENIVAALLGTKNEDKRVLNPYEMLIGCARGAQVEILLETPSVPTFGIVPNFNGNVPKIKGIADVWGRNPNNGRYYLADLKKVPNASPRNFVNAIRERQYVMQLAIYREAMRQQGTPIEDCYIVGFDENAHVNMFKFEEDDLQRGLQYAYMGCQLLDDIIDEGKPSVLLRSFTETRNSALYGKTQIYF